MFPKVSSFGMTDFATASSCSKHWMDNKLVGMARTDTMSWMDERTNKKRPSDRDGVMFVFIA